MALRSPTAFAFAGHRMGLIEFGRYRIGFWMAERTATPELPGGLDPLVEGSPVPGGVTLVLVAADDSGTLVWARLIHAAEGASLLLPWGDRLLVGLGSELLFLNDEGQVQGRYRSSEEWIAAWPLPVGLLLLARRGAHLIAPDLRPVWTWVSRGEGLHYMDADEASIRLAEMNSDDWREVRLEIGTGRELPDSDP